jgi:serine/threonine protein phosphatase PrpC
MTVSMTSTSEVLSEQAKSDLSFGASVAGPAHLASGLPNQDAWACTHWKVGDDVVHCAVVCDGLGSRAHAREGARAGIRAAKGAARQWTRAPGSPVSLLVRLVEILWRLEVTPLAAEDCATTCLIVLVLPEGDDRRVVTLALGDGQVVVESAQGLHLLGGRAEEQFSNVTVGLGTPHHMNDWQMQDLRTSGYCRVLLLSDGIADDVPEENVPELFLWLNDLEGRSASARGKILRRALRNWPVPGHSDDKTLVYLRLGGI